jgi:hypothetical protein
MSLTWREVHPKGKPTHYQADGYAIHFERTSYSVWARQPPLTRLGNTATLKEAQALCAAHWRKAASGSVTSSGVER